jgi:hypothetical protein
MRELLLQYALGSALVLLLVAAKRHEVRELVRHVLHRDGASTTAWLRHLIELMLSAVVLAAALDLFVDPLVAGVAEIEIHAPADPPTTTDHLQVRVVPIGLSGPRGGTRTIVGEFDAGGVAIVNVPLEMLESRVNVDVLDPTLTNPVVERRSVYLSPFVRRSLWNRVVDFRQPERSAIMISRLDRRAFVAVAAALWLGLSVSAAPQLKITYPTDNAHVSGKVIELTGTGADPNGQIEVSVFTNDWYPQNGTARIESSGNWTYSPVYVSGQGAFNNHMVRVTVISKGKRGASATIRGIVRQD